MDSFEAMAPSFRDDEEGLWIQSNIDNEAYDDMYSTAPDSPEMEEAASAGYDDTESSNEDQLINAYRSIAYRQTGPVMWRAAEENFEVLRRIQEMVGGHSTDEMRLVADEESDRQHLLFCAYQSEQGARQIELDYRVRMGSTASVLALALMDEHDNRSSSEVQELVFDALRPLDDRLRKLENQ